MAKLEGLAGAFAVNRQQIIWHRRRGWRTERQAGISLVQPAATLRGCRALTLRLGCCQESTEAAGMLAQLHRVNGEAAGF